ncbi:MAG: hypothetical protein KJ607_03120, partial [Bacteroidetes bacterium]|nr:hypothetical protein [Bacteroidota bacterium]
MKSQILLVVLLFSFFNGFAQFKFSALDRAVIERNNLDLKNLQFVTPDSKIFLHIIDAEKSNESKDNCIHLANDFFQEKIYFRPRTPLVCTKVDGKDIYDSFDSNYPSLLFREGKDGYYYLVIEDDGTVKFNSKEYNVQVLRGDFHLEVNENIKQRVKIKL